MLIRSIDPPPEEKPQLVGDVMSKLNQEADEVVNKALEDIGYSRDFVYRNYQDFRSILQDMGYVKDFNCEISVLEIQYKCEPVLLIRRIIDYTEWKLSYDWVSLLPEGALIL